MTDEIVVIGDVMLDIYDVGSAHRLSPEAPVLVLDNPSAQYALGGAGNTAANIVSLGGSARVLGAIGQDNPGDILAHLFQEAGVRVSAPSFSGYTTTTKRRFVIGHHQVLRVDHGVRDLAPADLDTILHEVQEIDSPVIVVSDYQKGVVTDSSLQHLFRRANELSARVIVDSKNEDYSLFRGAELITPNLTEALRASGERDPHSAAIALAEQTGSATLITLGESGMLLYVDREFYEIPSQSSEVADVTGAGDTVAAAMAVKMLEGLSFYDAALWANSAAGVAVTHFGTHRVRAKDLGIV